MACLPPRRFQSVFPKFSKDLRADGIHFMVFTPAGRASKVFETYGINKHEIQKIQYQLERLVEKYSTDTFKAMLDDFGYTFTWENIQTLLAL